MVFRRRRRLLAKVRGKRRRSVLRRRLWLFFVWLALSCLPLTWRGLNALRLRRLAQSEIARRRLRVIGRLIRLPLRLLELRVLDCRLHLLLNLRRSQQRHLFLLRRAFLALRRSFGALLLVQAFLFSLQLERLFRLNLLRFLLLLLSLAFVFALLRFEQRCSLLLLNFLLLHLLCFQSFLLLDEFEALFLGLASLSFDFLRAVPLLLLLSL